MEDITYKYMKVEKFKPFKIRTYSNAETNYVGFAIIDRTGYIWAVRRDLDKAEQRLKELEEKYRQGILFLL